MVSRRRMISHKKVVSQLTRRLRKYGLAKRDDFDRESATILLREMIESFSEIKVLRIKTPTGKKVKGFTWEEIEYCS